MMLFNSGLEYARKMVFPKLFSLSPIFSFSARLVSWVGNDDLQTLQGCEQPYLTPLCLRIT